MPKKEQSDEGCDATMLYWKTDAGDQKNSPQV